MSGMSDDLCRCPDAQAARGVTRRLLALLVRKEQQLDDARLEIADLEATIARSRPRLLAPWSD